MASSRRTLLAGTGAMMASLTGCLDDLLDGNRGLSLVLRNYTTEPQPMRLEILREVGNGNNDPEVLSREFTAPSPSEVESAGTVRRSNLVPERRYLVRVLLKYGRGQWNHHHYFPSHSGPAEIDIGVYRDEDSGALYTRYL